MGVETVMNEQDFHAFSRRSFLRGAALAGAGLGAGAVFPRAAWAALPPGEAAYPALTALVEGYVAKGTLPGVVALVGRGQDVPLAIARGVLTKGETLPATIDSLYRVYSMTKPVTGMAAMILIDEGKLRLDQPLADILPKYAKMQVQVTPDGSITDLRPAKGPITIRHLLTHTAGLGYTIMQKGPIKDAYEAAGLVPAQVSHSAIPGLSVPHPLPSLAEFADKLAEQPLLYDPGTVWSYSVSLDLLGRVIEVVSGKPFDAFLQERLFDPCGMTSTGFQVPASQAERLTTNYGIVNGALVPIDPAAKSIYLDKPAYPYGGAGIVTSPRDYDRFLAMLLGNGALNGRRVMNEAAVRLGTSDLLPEGTDTTRIWGPKTGFGAGGRVGLGEDAGTYGWSGAAGTVGFINYRTSLRAGIYVQYMPSGALPVQSDFTKALLADVTKTGIKKAA
ncbi:serine hydrolase [Novosphingobium sp. FKTRR1]|uniref:serine hydrolase domain-containing protein n=1 Tax=Novosphingobium sp. FKTRR1 TaxID=2879118 RepID=UPI001CF09C13|nr:serine hydrolase domain-containing protein [Novosphingobium sp. FKTRR1]